MGRRWGKTLMAGSVALACAARSGAVAWVVPTYRNARPLWRFCEQMAGGVGELHKSEMTTRFRGGGWLGIYTADNDVALRGEAFDLVICDEAAQMRAETITDVIMPTLADRDGRAMLISTPRGRNWFWQEYMRGLGDGKYQASFTAPSSANPMPTIRRAFELARARVSSRTFRQEWLAEFVEDGGGVFRNVEKAATSIPAEGAEPGHDYVIGCDWGRTNDATVYKVIDVQERREVYSDRMTETDFPRQLARLRALWVRFGQCAILAESNSMGRPQIEHANESGLPVYPFETTNESKRRIIDNLSVAFEQGGIRILNDALTIGELQAYEHIRNTATGQPVFGAPEGMHDDTVMALAIAWYGATYGVVNAVENPFYN